MAATENTASIPASAAVAKLSSIFTKKAGAGKEGGKKLRKLAINLTAPRKSLEGGVTPEQSNSVRAIAGN